MGKMINFKSNLLHVKGERPWFMQVYACTKKVGSTQALEKPLWDFQVHVHYNEEQVNLRSQMCLNVALNRWHLQKLMHLNDALTN